MLPAESHLQSGVPVSQAGHEPLRVMHVISGLGTGGAENFLLRLLGALRGADVDSRIISLGRGGGMVERFRTAEVSLTELGLTATTQWPRLPRALHVAATEVRSWRPHLIQGWMNHGNLAAYILRRIAAPGARLVWNIRQTLYDIRDEKYGTQLAIRLQSWISRSPDAIICNSRLGLEQHRRIGFRNTRLTLIPNGFDVQQFRPCPDSALRARALIGVDASTFLVAMVARFHPMKDHATFLQAISIAALQIPNLRAVCIGYGLKDRQDLRALMQRLRIEEVCALLDERADLERVYPGVDVACLTSAWGEGFPNVLGEAMACALPCVATDVGDTGMLLGGVGLVTPARSPESIAAAIVELFQMGDASRQRIGSAARARIVNDYSLESIARRYLDLYQQVCS